MPVDVVWVADAPIRQGRLDLLWERQQRIQPGPLQFVSGQLILAKQGARRLDPSFFAIIGPGAVSVFRMILKLDDDGAQIRGLRQDLERTAATEPTVAYAGPGGDEAGETGQTLCPAHRLKVFI